MIDRNFFKSRNNIILIATVFVLLISILWIYATSPNYKLESPTLVEIKSGTSLKDVSQQLRDQGLIKSRTILNTIIIITASDDKVVSGEYLFESPPTIFEVARRITTGDFGIEVLTVTIPEGATVEEISEIMAKKFPYFDEGAFLQLASDSEGMLFPDTYNFLETVKAFEVYNKLKDTFEIKIAEIKPILKKNNLTLDEVVKIASIVEKEATKDSREEVASIIWKRLNEDMLLQVDATFVYSIGKGTFDLTKKDLTDETNLYNTYVHKGLPPTPISNPGLESLKAAANALPTENFYFLTGRDGEMYYARNFEEHKKNRQRYLD